MQTMEPPSETVEPPMEAIKVVDALSHYLEMIFRKVHNPLNKNTS